MKSVRNKCKFTTKLFRIIKTRFLKSSLNSELDYPLVSKFF